MNFWAWATEHWFLGFILMYTAIQLPFKIFNRVLRSINIRNNGWPVTPYMDADGDIVYPKDGDVFPKVKTYDQSKIIF